MTLSLIAALDEQGAIGYMQNLLCHLPNDLKHFKKLTLRHTVIMGRKTFESLPGGALPQRKNVILSSKISVPSPGCLVYPSWETVMKAVESDGEVFVIGGVSIYRQALPLADTLYLTRIHHTFAQADAFFPPFDLSEWEEIDCRKQPADERHAYPYTFFTYRRKR